MKQFNKKEQIIFWKYNTELFKGDIISDIVLSFSKKYIGENAIDVGAGSGALLKNFKKRYKKSKITAIDLVPKHPEVMKGDCTKLPFDKNFFDTYFSTDLIEHLSDEDLDKCLSEANRVLKTGGYGIFITLYDEDLDSSKIICPECRCVFHRWGHCQVFNENRVKNIFNEKGFTIIKFRKINFGLIAKFNIPFRLFYLFRLNKVFKYRFFNEDLFLIVKKNKNTSP